MQELAREMIHESWISQKDNLEFICVRRSKWLMFRDRINDIFIRFWESNELNKEYNLHRFFIDNNFPVSQIIANSEKNGFALYSEKSIWEDPIWKMLMNNSITYEKAISYVEQIFIQYIKAQHKTINNKYSYDDIYKSNQLGRFTEENNELKYIDPDIVSTVFNKLKEDLPSYKCALTHWDFNTFNIFEKWVIDLEDSFNWIYWYDLISLLTHNYWFPIAWAEMTILFSFEIRDIDKFFAIYEKYSSDKIDDIFDINFILRWIWACCWMDDRPLVQKFRFERIITYFDAYLRWESIKDMFLEEVKEINIKLSENARNWS